MADISSRRVATRQIARWFSYEHLPAGTPRHVSAMCAHMAAEILREVPDGPELTAGLRKLLEAKDCFVRAAIGAADSAVTEPGRRAEITET
jgi:hypothetical protein